MIADLHSHTTASDGTLSPTELVELALTQRVDILAVTDHDTVDGLAEAIEAARAHRLRIVSGVEITARVPIGQLHLLAYFPQPPTGEIVNRLADLATRRRDRARRIVDRLTDAGAPISWDAVAARAQGSIGRPHIAAELVSRGHAIDTSDAFARYLADDAPAVEPSDGLDPEEAVRLVRASGGAPCLAHPATLRLDDDALDRLVETLVRAGLLGIEVHRAEHSTEQRRLYRHLADRYGLVPTGGSDFHTPTGQAVLGVTGDPRLPVEAIDRVLTRARRSGASIQ